MRMLIEASVIAALALLCWGFAPPDDSPIVYPTVPSDLGTDEY